MICQEKISMNINRTRLTKGKLKAILSQKYKGKVAEKIMSLFFSDLIVPLEYSKWIDLVEELLNSKKAKLQWIAFNVLDYNEDDHVC